MNKSRKADYLFDAIFILAFLMIVTAVAVPGFMAKDNASKLDLYKNQVTTAIAILHGDEVLYADLAKVNGIFAGEYSVGIFNRREFIDALKFSKVSDEDIKKLEGVQFVRVRFFQKE